MLAIKYFISIVLNEKFKINDVSNLKILVLLNLKAFD